MKFEADLVGNPSTKSFMIYNRHEGKSSFALTSYLLYMIS